MLAQSEGARCSHSLSEVLTNSPHVYVHRQPDSGKPSPVQHHHVRIRGTFSNYVSEHRPETSQILGRKPSDYVGITTT